MAKIHYAKIDRRFILSRDQAFRLFEGGFQGLHVSDESTKPYVPFIFQDAFELDSDSIAIHQPTSCGMLLVS